MSVRDPATQVVPVTGVKMSLLKAKSLIHSSIILKRIYLCFDRINDL